MNDLERLNLRGAVCEVTTRHQNPSGKVSIIHRVFDERGKLARMFGHDPVSGDWERDLEPLRPSLVVTESGLQIRTHKLSGVNAWGLEELPDIFFPTHKAHLAQTIFGSEVPVETLLLDESGNTCATIKYLTDSSGRVLEATQRLLEGGHPFPVSSALGNTPYCSVSFRYDERGRLLERKDFVHGHLLNHSVLQYNDFDDPVSEALNDGPPTTLRYEYDEFKNWICRERLHSRGVDLETRQLRYFVT